MSISKEQLNSVPEPSAQQSANDFATKIVDNRDVELTHSTIKFFEWEDGKPVYMGYLFRVDYHTDWRNMTLWCTGNDLELLT